MTMMIGSGVVAAVLAVGVPVAAGQDAKAADVLAKTRAALGKTEKVKTLSVEASMQRNMGAAQMSSDVELLVEMPDKYVKREESRGMMNMTMANGFNGDRAIRPAGATMAGGGAMIIRMGPGGPAHDGPKPTPEQAEQINAATLRSARAEASRFMLGWLGMAHPSLKAEYSYAGEAESPDGRAHVIDVKGPDGFESRLFIDQNNHLPLMLTYQGRAPRIMTSGPVRVTERPSGEAQGGKPASPPTEEERKKMAQDLEARMQK
jgi:predicted nucleotidyltransferase